MRPYLTHEHPIRFAHRGSRVLWPENTMMAFEGAVGLGYRYLEIDVHVSRDGEVVVFHDDRLERLTDGAGYVWDATWPELARLDAAHHFDPPHHPYRGIGVGIPRLGDLLDRWPEVLLNIDLKQDGIEAAVARVIERHAAEERVLIGSFHERRIARFRALTGGRIATSAGPGPVARFWAASRRGRTTSVAADAFQVPKRGAGMPLVDRRFVAAAHAAGLHVHVWTINDPAEMRRLLDLGVDGIVTDRPDLLDRVLDERR